jgi:hypothetical protein
MITRIIYPNLRLLSLTQPCSFHFLQLSHIELNAGLGPKNFNQSGPDLKHIGPDGLY